MSENWTTLAVDPPPRGAVRAFAVDDHALLLCNVDGDFFVIDDRCPHAGVARADGALHGCVLQCLLHGGKLDVRSGAPVAPPIRRRVACYEVRHHGDRIAVRLP